MPFSYSMKHSRLVSLVATCLLTIGATRAAASDEAVLSPFSSQAVSVSASEFKDERVEPLSYADALAACPRALLGEGSAFERLTELAARLPTPDEPHDVMILLEKRLAADGGGGNITVDMSLRLPRPLPRAWEQFAAEARGASQERVEQDRSDEDADGWERMRLFFHNLATARQDKEGPWWLEFDDELPSATATTAASHLAFASLPGVFEVGADPVGALTLNANISNRGQAVVSSATVQNLRLVKTRVARVGGQIVDFGLFYGRTKARATRADAAAVLDDVRVEVQFVDKTTVSFSEMVSALLCPSLDEDGEKDGFACDGTEESNAMARWANCTEGAGWSGHGVVEQMLSFDVGPNGINKEVVGVHALPSRSADAGGLASCLAAANLLGDEAHGNPAATALLQDLAVVKSFEHKRVMASMSHIKVQFLRAAAAPAHVGSVAGSTPVIKAKVYFSLVGRPSAIAMSNKQGAAGATAHAAKGGGDANEVADASATDRLTLPPPPSATMASAPPELLRETGDRLRAVLDGALAQVDSDPTGSQQGVGRMRPVFVRAPTAATVANKTQPRSSILSDDVDESGRAPPPPAVALPVSLSSLLKVGCRSRIN